MIKELYMINPKPNIQTRYNKAKSDTIKTDRCKFYKVNSKIQPSKIFKFIRSQASLNLQVKLYKFLNFTLKETIFVLTILQRI